MSLSKRTAKKDNDPIIYDPELLGEALKQECPEIVFALLLGSATEGVISAGSDLDIAVYVEDRPTGRTYLRIEETIESVVAGADVDLGFLNGNEPVYRFEALKGRLLFTRDQEAWLHFYSLTCREYEHWMYHYEKQRRYRLDFYEAQKRCHRL